jgi:hypothetical protein
MRAAIATLLELLHVTAIGFDQIGVGVLALPLPLGTAHIESDAVARDARVADEFATLIGPRPQGAMANALRRPVLLGNDADLAALAELRARGSAADVGILQGGLRMLLLPWTRRSLPTWPSPQYWK